MRQIILHPWDYSRYGLTAEQFPLPFFALGLEEKDTPLALLVAVHSAGQWEISTLECLHGWDEALPGKLLTAATMWAQVNGIAPLSYRSTLPRDQAEPLIRLLRRMGWSLEPLTSVLNLFIDRIPAAHIPLPTSEALLPLAKLPLPLAARLIASQGETEMASLGPLDPGLCVVYAPSETVEGYLLTDRQDKQYLSQVRLPQDREIAGQMLGLLVRLCQRRQIKSIALSTGQLQDASSIGSLWAGAVNESGVCLRARWTEAPATVRKENNR